MAVRIRQATFDDAEFLAWAMVSASRADLSRGLYHYKSFLIAEVADQRAAALCGCETDNAWEIVGDAMANVQRDLGWTEADAAASHLRVAPIWAACMPPDIGADFTIENVATRPEYRRRGLVLALIDEILCAASGRGCKLAQITTYMGNRAAQSAYEKSGFQVLDEKRCTEVEKILGVPGFIRLTRGLRID